MTTATAPHRRRIFCTSCGNIHRKNAGCAAQKTPEQDLSTQQLAKIAGMPDTEPYPRTALNLRRTAEELLDNAVVKEMHGKTAAAVACRKLAIARLQQAAEIDPASGEHYARRIQAINEEMKE